MIYWIVSCSHLAGWNDSLPAPVWVSLLFYLLAVCHLNLTGSITVTSILVSFLLRFFSFFFTGTIKTIRRTYDLLSHSCGPCSPVQTWVAHYSAFLSLWGLDGFTSLQCEKTKRGGRVSRRHQLRGNRDSGRQTDGCERAKHVVMTVPYSWVFGQ